jgi:hypothetical protein
VTECQGQKPGTGKEDREERQVWLGLHRLALGIHSCTCVVIYKPGNKGQRMVWDGMERMRPCTLPCMQASTSCPPLGQPASPRQRPLQTGPTWGQPSRLVWVQQPTQPTKTGEAGKQGSSSWEQVGVACMAQGLGGVSSQLQPDADASGSMFRLSTTHQLSYLSANCGEPSLVCNVSQVSLVTPHPR